jgi:hypothetical protein
MKATAAAISSAMTCAIAQAQMVYRAEPLAPGREPPITGRVAYEMDWRTIDAGAGRMSGEGALQLEGTAAQPDAGDMTDGVLILAGGFWATLAPEPACYANCDQSTTPPALNILDFNCFLSCFAAGDAYANCDGSTIAPALNILDFNCFLSRFASGCP